VRRKGRKEEERRGSEGVYVSFSVSLRVTTGQKICVELKWGGRGMAWWDDGGAGAGRVRKRARSSCIGGGYRVLSLGGLIVSPGLRPSYCRVMSYFARPDQPNPNPLRMSPISFA
jgi:hypothetical protein